VREGLISIITPAYQIKTFFKETFDCVIAQTYKDWQWIICEDASLDGSYEFISDLIKGHDNIILLKNEVNSGSAKSRNRALRRAEGQYIAFIDADDLWKESFLEEQLQFLKDTNSRLVYSSYYRLAEKSNTIFHVKRKNTYKSLLYTCDISPSTVLYNTEQYGVFYFRENLVKREDYAYWLSMLKKFPYCYGNRKALASVRIIKTSKTYDKKKLWKYQYHIYRNVEKLSRFASFWYTLSWSIHGVFKYLFVK
jgi:glycosyltransferase involved in cell wall biosynthesis